MMLTSIIMVTYNHLEEATIPCLESLYTHTPISKFELIIVDNASSDDTVEFLKKFKSQHDNVNLLINDTNRGFAGGNNDGLGVAKGEYIILLNNDTMVTHIWLDSLTSFLDKHKEFGMVGPVSNSVGNEQKIDIEGLTNNNYEKLSGIYTKTNKNNWFETGMLGFFCVAMRREVFEKIGLLDEGFKIGMFEDNDYCERVKSKGLKLAVKEDCFVYHMGSASFGKLNNDYYYELFTENKKYYNDKHNKVWSFKELGLAYWKKINHDLNEYKDNVDAVNSAIARVLVRFDSFKSVLLLMSDGSFNTDDEVLALKNKELEEKQNELMEISDWATNLNANNKELHELNANKKTELANANKSLQQYAAELSEAYADVQKKNTELMSMSDWATGMKVRLDFINQSRFLVFCEKLTRKLSSLKFKNNTNGIDLED